MANKFVDSAMEKMGAVERLLKGLPGIKGYVNKELRRDADKSLRTMIAGQLEEQRQALFGLQQKLMHGGGLQWMSDVDGVIQKLQILIDRVKTASYGYAGLFDAVRIREEQLDALNRFDTALAGRLVDLQKSVANLQNAIQNNENVGAVVAQMTGLLTDLNTLFNRRNEAVVSPDLLMDPSYAPPETPTEMPAETAAAPQAQAVTPPAAQTESQPALAADNPEASSEVSKPEDTPTTPQSGT